jgi:hypothetical protein
MRSLQQLSGSGWAMVAVGALLIFVSGFVLWGRRVAGRREDGERPVFSFPGVGVVSEPTRVSAGLFGLFLGYHLVVWAMPPSVTYMQFSRQYWWVLVVGGAMVVAISLFMDRRERGASDTE